MKDIVIVISTRNRPEVFKKTLKEWKRCFPQAKILTVDDCSDTPYVKATYRFPYNAGIAAVKSKSIELAYNTGKTHVVLADDDAYPRHEHALDAYINSGINHLCFTFGVHSNNTSTGMRIVKQDDKFTYWNKPCGPMLYFRREVFDKVGGMNPAFGTWGMDHSSFSMRIHNAGLTPYPYMDVVNSIDLFYSYDYYQSIKRSTPNAVRMQNIAVNRKRADRDNKGSEYIEFRQGEDTIIQHTGNAWDKWRHLLNAIIPAEHDRIWFVSPNVTMIEEPWLSMTPGRIHITHDRATIGHPDFQRKNRNPLFNKTIFSRHHRYKKRMNGNAIGANWYLMRELAQKMVDMRKKYGAALGDDDTATLNAVLMMDYGNVYLPQTWFK